LEGFLQAACVTSNEQIADIMTKPLSEAQHGYLCSRLGLLEPPPIPSWGGDVRLSGL